MTAGLDVLQLLCTCARHAAPHWYDRTGAVESLCNLMQAITPTAMCAQTRQLRRFAMPLGEHLVQYQHVPQRLTAGATARCAPGAGAGQAVAIVEQHSIRAQQHAPSAQHNFQRALPVRPRTTLLSLSCLS